MIHRERQGTGGLYFFIDFENVNNNGMKGVEFIQPTDHVLIFYSGAAPNMENKILETLRESRCDLQVFKLFSKKRNGLDFYICTKLGECLALDGKELMAIISKDNDYNAVRDFWIHVNPQTKRVIIRNSVEKAIIDSGEGSDRVKILREMTKQVDLGKFYAAYQERQRIQALLSQIFSDTEYASALGEVEEMLTRGGSPKIIYLDALHRFGRKGGLEIYRRLKEQKVI